jgi:hypothetical protein
MVDRFSKSRGYRPGYLRAGRFLFFLFIASLMASAHVHFSVFRQAPSLFSAASAFGGAIPAFAIATLIIIPWRMVERRLGRISGTPLFVGTLMWVLVWYVTYRGALMEQNASYIQAAQTTAYRYQVPGCEFAVTFPSAPTMLPGVIPVDGERFEQAFVVTATEHLSAECALTSKPPTQGLAILVLGARIGPLGLNLDVKNTTIDVTSAKVVRLRGYKTISGQAITFEFEIHLGKTSMLSLVAAAGSSDYPTAGVSEFFSSLVSYVPQ